MSTPDEVEEPTTGVLMFVAYRAMEQFIFDTLRSAGFDDVSLAQGRLFARIQERGNRLTELAEMAQMTKQAAQSLVDVLEYRGYVERVPDPTDARARLIRVADRGEKVRKVARHAELAVETEWTAHLGVAGMQQLRAAVLKLREITDPYAD